MCIHPEDAYRSDGFRLLNKLIENFCKNFFESLQLNFERVRLTMKEREMRERVRKLYFKNSTKQENSIFSIS